MSLNSFEIFNNPLDLTDVSYLLKEVTGRIRSVYTFQNSIKFFVNFYIIIIRTYSEQLKN